MNLVSRENPWTRSKGGWIAGVCQAMAERFDINVSALRLIWVLSILFMGFGFIFYVICAVCLPVEDKVAESRKPKLMGVCLRLSERIDIDLGLLRVLAVVLAIGSVGTSLLAYIIIHFILTPQVSR